VTAADENLVISIRGYYPPAFKREGMEEFYVLEA
jgi:hypothetical protein